MTREFGQLARVASASQTSGCVADMRDSMASVFVPQLHLMVGAPPLSMTGSVNQCMGWGARGGEASDLQFRISMCSFANARGGFFPRAHKWNSTSAEACIPHARALDCLQQCLYEAEGRQACEARHPSFDPLKEQLLGAVQKAPGLR